MTYRKLLTKPPLTFQTRHRDGERFADGNSPARLIVTNIVISSFRPCPKCHHLRREDSSDSDGSSSNCHSDCWSTIIVVKSFWVESPIVGTQVTSYGTWGHHALEFSNQTADSNLSSIVKCSEVGGWWQSAWVLEETRSVYVTHECCFGWVGGLRCQLLGHFGSRLASFKTFDPPTHNHWSKVSGLKTQLLAPRSHPMVPGGIMHWSSQTCDFITADSNLSSIVKCSEVGGWWQSAWVFKNRCQRW